MSSLPSQDFEAGVGIQLSLVSMHEILLYKTKWLPLCFKACFTETLKTVDATGRQVTLCYYLIIIVVGWCPI